MTEAERKYALDLRKARSLPWHSPPHLNFAGLHQYLISASCYEHAHVIGKDPQRMTDCESTLLGICKPLAADLYAWCVLPNHYHIPLRTEHIKELLEQLGEFHGSSSYEWNGQDSKRGRKVWYNCFERFMKSERHFFATLNYVHHNPVHHGYVKLWQDWPWSSAREFLEKTGHEKAKQLWLRYPILDYGKKWDIF